MSFCGSMGFKVIVNLMPNFVRHYHCNNNSDFFPVSLPYHKFTHYTIFLIIPEKKVNFSLIKVSGRPKDRSIQPFKNLSCSICLSLLAYHLIPMKIIQFKTSFLGLEGNKIYHICINVYSVRKKRLRPITLSIAGGSKTNALSKS